MTFKPFNSRLELLWTFDDEDTSASTATDSSDNSNTGSINGGVTTGFPGVNNGEAFDFNGTDGSVEASTSPSLEITDELTLSAWVNLDSLPSSTGTPMDIASKGDHGGGNSRYQITVETNDCARFQITDSTDGSHRITSTTSLETNQWYHITGRFNGDEIEIFVDGVQENAASHSVTLLNESQPFFVGRNSYSGGPEWLDGQIDDVRVYSAPLSDDQIATLTLFRSGNLQRGLIDHWTMDDRDRSGSTSSSRTPSGNIASLSGNISQTSAPIGEGHQFDGSDDLFEFSEIKLDRLDATLSFWVNPDSASTQYTAISNSSGVNQMIELHQGKISCETNTNGNRFTNHNYTLKDEWHHITVVFSQKKAFWYENGEFQNEATSYGIDNYTDNNSVEKMVDGTSLDRIGKSVYKNKFTGGVSDLRFYDRALSDAEVNDIYQMRSQRSKNVSPYELRPRAGEPQNKMDATQWDLHTNGDQGDFSDNGGSAENSIVRGVGPYSDVVDLWYGRSEDSSSSSDGGWNWGKLNTEDIDRSKTYRYSVWVKTEFDSGSYYHGTENVKNSDGTFNSNPYYDSGDLPSNNDWYLVVGYNHPQNASLDINESAIYDTNGNVVQEIDDFWWADDADFGSEGMRWRSYYYYDTNISRGAFFYDPRLEIVDGTETPLSELINPASDVSGDRSKKFFDGFDTGNLNKWDVNQAQIVSDRVRTGPYSVYCTNAVSGDYQFRAQVEAGGSKISKLEYWFQETGTSTGAGVRLKNSNGNYELGVATDNAEWDLEDGNGFQTNLHPTFPNYDQWVRFTLTFDWDNSTFGVDFEQPASGISFSNSGYPLKNGSDVEYIEAWEYNGGGWGGGTIDQWYDSFEVNL